MWLIVSGFCQIQVAQSQTTSPDPFMLLPITGDMATVVACIQTAASATVNYLLIPGGQMVCGEVLGDTLDQQTAGVIESETTGGGFEFTYVVNDQYQDPSSSATGFSLDYTQTPC